MSTMNRKGNSKNPYQGKFKKVLCVCSAGLLRSPTAALVLSQEPFNFNTRAAGVEKEFALVPVDEVLVDWADEVVCMDAYHASKIRALDEEVPIIILNIEDSYGYRDPILMQMIKKNYEDHIIMARAQERMDNELDEQQ